MICESTGKVCYTEREAGTVINSSRKHIYIGNNHTIKSGRANSKNIPRRKYFCEECRHYHVTHLALYDIDSQNRAWEEAFYKEINGKSGKKIGA